MYKDFDVSVIQCLFIALMFTYLLRTFCIQWSFVAYNLAVGYEWGKCIISITLHLSPFPHLFFLNMLYFVVNVWNNFFYWLIDWLIDSVHCPIHTCETATWSCQACRCAVTSCIPIRALRHATHRWPTAGYLKWSLVTSLHAWLHRKSVFIL